MGKPVAFEASADDRETRGIHFDDNHFASLRMHGKLNVGTACLHANFAHDGDGGVAHDLIFLIRQCLRQEQR